MKKILAILAIVLITAINVSAQSSYSYYFNSTYFAPCQATTNNIVPPTDTVAGIFPNDTTLPCAVAGQYVSDTLHFHNFHDFSGQVVNYLTIDSIYLPTGLCWSTNKANNSFTHDEDGTILIQGTTAAPAGQYKFRIVVDAGAGSNGINLLVVQNVDLEALSNIRYSLRVKCPATACLPINTVDTANAFIADSNTCNIPTPIIATISPSSNQIICPETTVFFAANTGNGYTYRWSTGSTNSVLLTNVAGIYTVTVYSGSDSAVSAPVSITTLPAPTARFQLIPDPNTSHTWTIVNQCAAGLGVMNYTWDWGDDSTSAGATPSHTYDSAGYYTICVFVSDSSYSCEAHYCDTNAYLYKTENQMVQVNVVQYALGIDEASQKSVTLSYYANAIHFSEAINAADIKLYDLSGKVVMKLNNWSGRSIPLDGDIVNGLYIIAVQNNAMSLSRKLDIIR